jgi:DNA-binding transcriptional MerR regulator
VAADNQVGPLLSIGDVSEATGIAQHVLRYWEGRLPQLRPVKRAGGRRYYRAADVALLRDVQRLIDQEGFTLDGAARALSRGGQAASVIVPTGGSGAVPMAKLQHIRDRLAKALRAG